MTDIAPTSALLDPTDTFVRRHIGPSESDLDQMLLSLGFESLEALVERAVPASIRIERPLALEGLDDSRRALGEKELLARLRHMMEKNADTKPLIGMGYYGCHTPAVIQRNILENPGWYTQYTPYQAEIAQGRLEALLNFQTII
ncbi:MAG: hypothetical protein MI919_00015, partial [Holophagales bacterium]|nr:hypothetical protein [Holophagales bacterium]